MHQRLWIFLFMFEVCLMNVQSVRDINDIEFLPCSVNVLHQCKCGQNGTLQEVYVESCPMNTKEDKIYECFPCSDACLKFSNCSSCSKNKCITCPHGRTGDFCEHIEKYFIPTSRVLQLAKIQNLTSTTNETNVAQDLLFHNNSKLPEIDIPSSYEDSPISNSFEDRFDDFISNLLNIEDWFHQKTNITFVDFDNISSLDYFISNESIISDIINIPLSNNNFKIPDYNNSNNLFFQPPFDGVIDEFFLYSDENGNKNFSSFNATEGAVEKNLQFQSMLRSENQSSNIINESDVSNLNFKYSLQFQILPDEVLNVWPENQNFKINSEVSNLEVNDNFQFESLHEDILNQNNLSSNSNNKKDYANNQSLNTINISVSNLEALNLDPSSINIKDIIDYTLYNDSSIYIKAYREEKVKNNSLRSEEKHQNKYNHANSIMSKDKQDFINSKNKNVDFSYGPVDFNRFKDQYSLENFDVVENEFSLPNEYFHKISLFPSQENRSKTVKNSKRIIKSDPLVEDKNSGLYSNPNTLTDNSNSHTQNKKHNKEKEASRGDLYNYGNNVLTQDKLNNNLQVSIQEYIPINEQGNAVNIDKLSKVTFVSKLPERETKERLIQKKILKDKDRYSNTYKNVSIHNIKTKVENKNKSSKIMFDNGSLPNGLVIQNKASKDDKIKSNVHHKILMGNKLSINMQGESSMQNDVAKNTEDGSLNRDEPSVLPFSQNLLRGFTDNLNKKNESQKAQNKETYRKYNQNKHLFPFLYFIPDERTYCKLYPFDPICSENYQSKFYSYNANFPQRHAVPEIWKDEFQGFRIKEHVNATEHKSTKRSNNFYIDSLDKLQRQPENFHSYNSFALPRNLKYLPNQNIQIPNKNPYVKLNYGYNREYNNYNDKFSRNYKGPPSFLNNSDFRDNFRERHASHNNLNNKFNVPYYQYFDMYNMMPLNENNYNNYNHYNEPSTILNYKDIRMPNFKNQFSYYGSPNERLNYLISLFEGASNFELQKYPKRFFINAPKTEKIVQRPLNKLSRQDKKSAETILNEKKDNLMTKNTKIETKKNSNPAEYSILKYVAANKSNNQVLKPSKFQIFKSTLPIKTYSKMMNNQNSSLISTVAIHKAPLQNISRDQSLSMKYKGKNALRRMRRESDDSWCPIVRQSLHGNLECLMWAFKKICWLECHSGYKTNETSFVCFQSINQWLPNISPCIGKEESDFDNENDTHSIEDDISSADHSYNKDNSIMQNELKISYGDSIESTDDLEYYEYKEYF